MKIRFFLLATILAASFTSCQKQYEPVPLGEQITLDYAFDTKDSAGVLALSYLSTCYLEALPNGHNRVNGDYLDAASDDAVSNKLTVSAVQQMATGAYSAGSPNGDDDWTHNYSAIRDCNIFINDIYRVPLAEKLLSGRPAIAAYRSEARFLRAWEAFFIDFPSGVKYAGAPESS